MTPNDRTLEQQGRLAAAIGEYMEPKYISTGEASRLYGIPKKTLENWRSQKRGPRYHKSGKRVVYRVVDLEAFMDEHAIATIDQPFAKASGE